MSKVPEENSSERRPGLATVGKFRKRLFRRSQTKPYDRPPTALRNPGSNNGWFTKLLDPAQRLITYSAHSLFSSVFRKRLPAPAPQNPSSSETEQKLRDNHQGKPAFVAATYSGKQQGAVGEHNVQINSSDGGRLTELEKLLSQKTFTRSEIDHLTALMQSRSVDPPVKGEEKRTESAPSKPVLPLEQKEEYPKTSAVENGIENHLVVTPYVTSSIPYEDVASPAELARAYMGSRPSEASSSILGLRSPALTEDSTLFKSQNFALKSPIMSIVPRATRHTGVHENSFVTSKSHGRSAIYNMDRTPYARFYPTSAPKVGGLVVEGGPSSSAQSTLDHDILNGSKQGALKRRSSALNNGLGFVSPIRRVRQKCNLLYPKGLSVPLSGSPLCSSTSRVGIDAAQQPSSSMQKPILLDEINHSHMNLSTQTADGTMPSMSMPASPSKSSEMGSKILQQLDKMASPNKEKSSGLRMPTVNNKSPTKLSPSMLSGQALRSMETVDSCKLLDNIRDNKVDCTVGNLSGSAHKLTSQTDKVENGPLKLLAHSDGLVPVTNTDSKIPSNQVVSSSKYLDSSMAKPVSYHPQKRAFCMSAHEDYLDLDDDALTIGAVSSLSPAEKEKTGSTSMEEKTTIGSESIVPNNPPALSVVMPSRSSTIDGKAHIGTADGSVLSERVLVSTSIMSSIPDPTFQPETVAVMEATQTIFGSNKPVSPNGSIAIPALFNFGNKLVSSTVADGPSKESTKSAPIFGLQNVNSSKDPGADAPSVSFSTRKNDDKVSQMLFTSSVSGESAHPKFGASSDSKLGCSICVTTVAGATDSMAKVLESDNTDSKAKTVAGFSVRLSELAVSSAASTSLLTSPTSIFTFGHNSNQNNGPHASSTSFSSPFPSLVSNNFTSQNMSSSSTLAASSSASGTAASATNNMISSTPAIIASSNSSSSTPVVASSPSTTSFFKFGSSPVPSTGLPVSSSSGSEPVETKSGRDAGVGNQSSTAFGSSSTAGGSTGSGIFGFSSSALTTVNSQSEGSVFSTSSGSVLGAQASPAVSGFAPSQSQSVPSGASTSPPSFAFCGNAAFSSGSSLFSSSSPATNIFNSGTTFGLSTSASSSAANSVNSCSGSSSTLFGSSSWQPNKSPFGSAFSSSSSSGFSFVASTAPNASTSSPTMFTSVASSQFAFTSAVATTTTLPAFGSSNPVLPFGLTSPVNNDQMSMEDSMAEDTVQATPPATPLFGQQSGPPQSNFVFGASALSAPSPFQFGSQQNFAPQNQSPFQASGSVDFSAVGGSFSLGTSGGDKSGRKIVKVKHKPRKK